MVGGSWLFPRASRRSSNRLVNHSTGPKTQPAATVKNPNSRSKSWRRARICAATALLVSFSRCSIAHRTPA